jgi:hypothetical protein
MTRMRDKFSNVQFGIRTNLRTTDSLFLFKTLINKYINCNKKQFFSSFIDLRKAFDSVWRKCLFYKLLASGGGHKTIDIIQNMYSETQSSLRMNNSFTTFFNINRGVRQGDSLTFILMIFQTYFWTKIVIH